LSFIFTKPQGKKPINPKEQNQQLDLIGFLPCIMGLRNQTHLHKVCLDLRSSGLRGRKLTLTNDPVCSCPTEDTSSFCLFCAINTFFHHNQILPNPTSLHVSTTNPTPAPNPGTQHPNLCQLCSSKSKSLVHN